MFLYIQGVSVSVTGMGQCHRQVTVSQTGDSETSFSSPSSDDDGVAGADAQVFSRYFFS